MDSPANKERFVIAARRVLRPIVRLLLKAGWTWKEFAELGKTVFVEVATEEFGIRGRPTNASRVAILTGLDRREVKKQRDLLDAEAPAEAPYMSRASRLLSGWHQDPDYLREDGAPRDLPPEGEGGFAELVMRHAGDVPATAMLKELRAAGVLEVLEGGLVRVLKRTYVPRVMDEAQLRLWSSVLEDIGNVLEHNLTRAPDTLPQFERRATNLKVDVRALPAFRTFLEREGLGFLVRVDDWLTAHAVPEPDQDTKTLRLGAGVYLIEERRKRGTRE